MFRSPELPRRNGSGHRNFTLARPGVLYPWPTSPTDAQRQALEKSAQAVLDARAKFPDSTLADLYDPVTMPPVLVKAHADLDRAVERCYRKDPFPTDRSRVEFLFALYEDLTAPLVSVVKPRRARKAEPL